MSLYNGPPRGGTRGGKDQFSWEAVKNDKDRDYYLGHSVMASTGRWQKGRDILWYTRGKGGDADQQAAEMRAVKEQEEQIMAEALGLKPKSLLLPPPPPLDARELAILLKRNNSKDTGEAGLGGATANDPDRIQGLGYAPGAVSIAGGAAVHETLQGVGVPAASVHAASAGPSGHPQPHHSMPHLQTAQLSKEERKAAKRAKKEAKKAHKEAKRSKKKTSKDESGGKPAQRLGHSASADFLPSPSEPPAVQQQRQQEAPPEVECSAPHEQRGTRKTSHHHHYNDSECAGPSTRRTYTAHSDLWASQCTVRVDNRLADQRGEYKPGSGRHAAARDRHDAGHRRTSRSRSRSHDRLRDSQRRGRSSRSPEVRTQHRSGTSDGPRQRWQVPSPAPAGIWAGLHVGRLASLSPADGAQHRPPPQGARRLRHDSPDA